MGETTAEGRGDGSRHEGLEATACGGRTSSPPEAQAGGHCLGAPARRSARGAVLRAAALAAVLALAVGACGGDDGGEDEGAGGGAATTAPAGEGTSGGAGEGTTAEPVPSAACAAGATPAAEMAESTLTVAGEARRYLATAPAWAEGDAPPPLVLDFHGLAEGAEVHAGMTQLGPLGLEEGFVTVFPHGRGQPVRWDVAPDVEANADLAYVVALLDKVGAERCVDTSRVYATGLSNGAMMSSVVACALSDRVAAIAPVAGVAFPDGCAPERPVPVLAFHGTADPILLFNGGVNGAALDAAMGGGSVPSTTVPADLEGAGYPESVRQWAEVAGCEAEPSDEEVGTEVLRRTYDCPEDAAVEFVVIEGGGHSWPSSEFSRTIEGVVGYTTFEIDASAEAWAFFQRFHLPA